MFLKSHEARKLAVAGVAALAAFGASATTASAAQAKLNFTCTYPLIGAQPLALDIDTSLPSTVAANSSTGAIAVKATAIAGGGTLAGLQTIGGASVEGIALSEALLTGPAGLNQGVAVDINIPKTAIPKTGTDLTLPASGSAVALFLEDAGVVTTSLKTLPLNMTVRKADGTPIQLPPVKADSDGDKNTFDVDCLPNPSGQDLSLAKTLVTNGSSPADTTAPTQPGTLSSTVNDRTAALKWNPSSDGVGVSGYDIYQNGNKVASAAGTSSLITGLSASTTYKFKVVARDAAGNSSPASNEISPKTLATIIDPTEIDYGYSLKGTAALKKLVTGTLPLNGSIDAKVKLADGSFNADLVIKPTLGRLTALGFLPVTAQIAFVNNGKTTGTLKNGVLQSKSILRIKLQTVKLFGAVQLAGGNNCQTKQLSTINLKSTQSSFYALEGGPIGGQFAMSDLNGCGILEGLVSVLTSGGGNLINANLTPKA